LLREYEYDVTTRSECSGEGRSDVESLQVGNGN
jgi:hypothetical protein